MSMVSCIKEVIFYIYLTTLSLSSSSTSLLSTQEFLCLPSGALRATSTPSRSLSMAWAITAKTWPSALLMWRSTILPRRETAGPAQRPGVCRKVAVWAVSTTRPEPLPCVSSVLQVCKPSVSPDGLRAKSLSPVNCFCRRLDMQLHPQDQMIVCSESPPQCESTGRLCWLTVDPPHNDRFLKIMMIEEAEAADTFHPILFT